VFLDNDPLQRFCTNAKRPMPRRNEVPDVADAGNIFVREGTPLPEALQLESEPYLPGWRLVKNLAARGLERKLRQAGWNFFCLAGYSHVSVFGFDEEKAVQRAVERILANRTLKRFNVLEITRVSSGVSKRFLGVCYVTLCAQSRHIQESVFLSETKDVQERDRDTLTPAA
jgi:hypothetical protein